MDLKGSEKVTLADILYAVNELRKEISDHFVRKEEFAPVKAVVYGMVGLILITVIGGILFLVIK